MFYFQQQAPGFDIVDILILLVFFGDFYIYQSISRIAACCI